MNTIRNFTLFFFILFSFTSLKGQFDFTSNNQAYNSLHQSITINSETVWDDHSFEVPIGFTFSFLDKNYDFLTIENGIIKLGNQYQLVALGGADLRDRGAGSPKSLSPISYQIEENSNGKIFKLEIRNAGFYDGFSKDAISFQVWLYESNFSIEYHYGESTITHPELVYFGTKGPYVGIGKFVSNQFTGDLIQNKADVPTITKETNAIVFNLNRLNETPASGIVYRFVPKNAPTKSINPLATNFSTLFKIRTTPLFESLNAKPFTFNVFNLNGQRLPQWTKEESAQVIHYDYEVNNSTLSSDELATDKTLSPN